MIFHGFFDAGNADNGVVGIALGGVLLHVALGVDAAHIAHGVGGGAALRVDAGGTLLGGHAVQFHGARFDLRNGFKAHVVGDGYGAGVVVVHARGLPDGEYLDDHVLVLLDDLRVCDAGGCLRPLFLDDLLAQNVDDQVLFQQRVKELLFRRAGEVEVGAPLALAGGVDRFGSGIGGKAPDAVLVLFQPELRDGRFAVGLHQLDGLENGARIGLAVRLRAARRIAVKSYIVTAAVVGKRRHVDIVDGAAHAGDGKRLGRARCGARGGRLLSVDHHAVQAEKHRRERDDEHQTDDEHAILIGPQKDFTSRLADVRR